ncbi:protein deacetylase HDAC6 [Lampetra fluviatilis]
MSAAGAGKMDHCPGRGREKPSSAGGKRRNRQKMSQESRKSDRIAQVKQDRMGRRMAQLDVPQHVECAYGTGLVFDTRMEIVSCPWESHVECPERAKQVLASITRSGLLPRCSVVEPRMASVEELMFCHSQEYIRMMQSTAEMSDQERKSLSDTFDSVYLHKGSYDGALLAVGSVLRLVERVLTGDLRNGFALVRPPGHHAQRDLANGYCIFNNVAIAAQYALSQHQLQRVLIVDWDVHHGQGIQYTFQDDPRVLYFSVHRHEGGAFWPHLPEGDVTAVGRGIAKGFNINLPWSRTGMSDADYVTAFQQILMPVAYQFSPQLVLVSAGYDAALGDPKGEMCVSPPCFGLLTHMLMSLANGRLCLALEGGYNLEATAAGVCATLHALVGDPVTSTGGSRQAKCSALEDIGRTLATQQKYWSCLRCHGLAKSTSVSENDDDKESKEIDTDREKDPTSTTETGVMTTEEKTEVVKSDATETPVAAEAVVTEIGDVVVMGMVSMETRVTGLVYDKRMMDHHNMWDRFHPEQPDRISVMFSRHEDLGLVGRCHMVTARLATQEELLTCHSVRHVNAMRETTSMKARDLHRCSADYNSVYLSPSSFDSACLAAGAALSLVEAAMCGQVSNGVAIVRPPGHHAESDVACGFCLFNTVALAAKHAQSLARRKIRVLIVDWDVHHGNGTQHIFEDDPSVLYVSLHRYDGGRFFPCSEDANVDRVGTGPGKGFNVNVPWPGPYMRNAEYLAAFMSTVLPIAYEFDPELVLVSAGFDAAQGDPLGLCMVTPDCYAHMTHMLLGLANGRVLLFLEGGYNLTTIAECMAMCTRTLLGDPTLALGPLEPPQAGAERVLTSVLHTHSPLWHNLRIPVPLTEASPEDGQRGDDLLTLTPAAVHAHEMHFDKQHPAADDSARSFASHSFTASSLGDTGSLGSSNSASDFTDNSYFTADSPMGSTSTPHSASSPQDTTASPGGCASIRSLSVSPPRAMDSPDVSTPLSPPTSAGAASVSTSTPAGSRVSGANTPQDPLTPIAADSPLLPPLRPRVPPEQSSAAAAGTAASVDELAEAMASWAPGLGSKAEQTGSSDGRPPHVSTAKNGLVPSDGVGLSAGVGSRLDGAAVGGARPKTRLSDCMRQGQEEDSPMDASSPHGGIHEDGSKSDRTGVCESEALHGGEAVRGESIRAVCGGEAVCGESEAVCGESEAACGGETGGPCAIPGKDEVASGIHEDDVGLAEASGWTPPSLCYAVKPLSWCPHLDAVTAIPGGVVNPSSPCVDCGDSSENWLCLVCYQAYCGRYVRGHMLQHSEKSGHALVLSFADLSAWCYSCDSYVHHELLFPAKRAAYRSKFDEEMPGLP